MKVLIADKFEQSGIDGLKALGCEVIFEPDLKDAALAEAIGKTQADILVVRSTVVTEAMMDAGHLDLIVRAGAGYNTIDVTAASKRGVFVSNCPGKNSIAVAELAFGLIIGLDRRIPDNVAELRLGKWNKKEYSKAKGLHGMTLGLLGFGKIGQEMAKRAMAFGMNLAIWSEIGVAVNRESIPVDLPLLLQIRPGSESLIAERITVCKTPAEVAENCDILSIHVAAGPLTKNVVNLAEKSPATHALIIRHKDRPGVLAHVFTCLREANINVQETENIIFSAAEAAVARVNMDTEPTAPVIARIKSNPDILDTHLVTMGAVAGA